MQTLFVKLREWDEMQGIVHWATNPVYISVHGPANNGR